jgi:hypothetical protein
MRVPSDADPGDYLSIDRVEPRDGDLLIVVELRCRGFTGRIDTWILREAWLAFCEQLERLEEVRRGEASVESMSPRELRLAVRATDAAGHMAVEGVLGYRGVHGEMLLSFSAMPFDPSILPRLVHEAREVAG